MDSRWNKLLLTLIASGSVVFLGTLASGLLQAEIPSAAQKTEVEAAESPTSFEIRKNIREIGDRSFDELVAKMSDDSVYSHFGLLNGGYESLFFEYVLADRNNRRLIHQIGLLPPEDRLKLVLVIFEKHFKSCEAYLNDNTSGLEEVAKYLRSRGKQDFTRADFHSNMTVGVNLFPEGWNRVTERSHAGLSATFLVATYGGIDNTCKVLKRWYDLQNRRNGRLEKIGYPDVPRDSVGLESQFFVSVLWYGSDQQRCGNQALGMAIRKIISDSVESNHLKIFPTEMVGWDAALDAFDVRADVIVAKNVKELDRSKGVTPVDVFRWTCSEETRTIISQQLLNCCVSAEK